MSTASLSSIADGYRSWGSRIRNPIAARRWREIAEAEAEIERRENVLRALDERVVKAREKLATAEQKDAATREKQRAAGDYEPEPDEAAPAARAELEALQAQFARAAAGAEAAEEARASLIEARRELVVADAERLIAERVTRFEQLVGELRDARAELVEAAELRLWALTFPSDAAAQMPLFDCLGCSVVKAGKTLGVGPQRVKIENVYAALHLDAEVVSQIATQEQRRVLVERGEAPRDASREAEWHDPDRARSEHLERLEELAEQAAAEYGVERARLTQAQFDDYYAALDAGEFN